MQVTSEELAILLGLKDIEIMVLQKEIAELRKRLSALEVPKPETLAAK